jgi:hypothetical protein
MYNMTYIRIFVIVAVIALLLIAIPLVQQQIAHAQNQTLSCVGVGSCYEQGYAQGKAHPGTSCTEAQKEIQTDEYINYCAGYRDGSGLTTSAGGSNTGVTPIQTPNTTLLCNSAVCDNSQFKEFAFDYDLNLLNIHIHKHSGVWHNERGVFVPWSALCNQGNAYLIQSCSDLIDSNGTLTPAGDRAVGCITNGAIITLGANLYHISPDIVKSALGVLAPMTGCDGIVNLNTIQTGPQLQSLLTALSNAANP